VILSFGIHFEDRHYSLTSTLFFITRNVRYYKRCVRLYIGYNTVLYIYCVTPTLCNSSYTPLLMFGHSSILLLLSLLYSEVRRLNITFLYDMYMICYYIGNISTYTYILCIIFCWTTVFSTDDGKADNTHGGVSIVYYYVYPLYSI